MSSTRSETNYICTTCGTQFSARHQPPQRCPICEDERQYVGWEGQEWTTLQDLQGGHHNQLKVVAPRLTGIGTQPAFAIGQRALLVHTAFGNVLWDCVSLLDQATIAAVEERGGIQAIAISHPHFFSSMVEWNRAFNAPIYLHEDHQPWVMRRDDAIQYWTDDRLKINPDLTLIRVGGHFPGSSVLHWSRGDQDQGALLSGDTIQVVSDRRYVSFMYSYPNLIPLSPDSVRDIVSALEPFSFQRIYGGWWDRNVAQDGKQVLKRSAQRYIAALQNK